MERDDFVWLGDTRVRFDGAGGLSGVDGFVTAIVAGPVSMPPPDWICPLLDVEADAFNHDNEEFSAIAAWRDIAPAIVAMREYWQPIGFNKNA